MTLRKNIIFLWSETIKAKVWHAACTDSVLCNVNALPQHSITQKPFIPYMLSHGFDIHMVLYDILSIRFHQIKHVGALHVGMK